MSAALTFVVPAYNASATLGDTIESVLAQDGCSVELVVVDDGSVDGTGDVARSFGDPWIRLVRQRNAGLASARNTGLREVTTEFVTFLDSDDTVSPGYAEKMIGAIDGYDLVACSWSFVGDNLEDLGWTCDVLDRDREAGRLVEVNPFAVGCVVHRTGSLRARVEPTSGQAFDPTLRVLEDWDLLLRLTRMGVRWAPVIDEPLFRYRLRPGSLSSGLSLMHDTAIVIQDRHRHTDDRERGLMRRDLVLRSLARAMAHEESDLIASWSSEALTLDQRDLGVIGGALRIAFGRADGVNPRGLSPARCAQRIGVLDLGAKRSRELLAMVVGDSGMGSAAGRLGELGSSARIVIAGMGRNGSALARALQGGTRGQIEIAWIDDSISAHAPAGWRRIGFDELERSDVVVLTPDDPGDLGRRARARGVALVVPLARLGQDATAGLSEPPA